jgi:hypothetical protein
MAYLSPVRQDHQTLIFVVGQEGRPKTFDGRRCLVLPPQGKAATYINLVTEDAGSPKRLRTYLPDLAEVRRFKDDAGALYAVARRISPSSPQVVVPTYRVEASLGNAVEILGYDVSTEVTPPGQVLVVTVYWRAKSTLSQDYTAFVHLLGPFNPATGGPLWAQEDSQPGQGTYPTSRWSPGEVVVEEYRLQVPQEAPAGKYSVQAGIYLLATLGRLPVIRNGLPAGDSVTLTAVDIPLRF